MPAFKKAILKIGKYQSPDGEVDVTPTRLRHFASTFRKMRGKGLGIPVGWDHSDKAEETIPVQFSTAKGPRSSRGAAGWLQKFDVAKDGKSAEISLELGSEAAGKARDNVVEVSPIIYPRWRDGRGRTWQDCITHVDLVTHPVDDSQTPFVEESLACSLRMGLNVKPYRLATDDDDEEPKDGAQGVEDIANETPDRASEEKPDMPEVETDDQQMDAIVAHLEQLGVVLPHDTDDSNFEDRLLTALMTANKQKQDAEQQDTEEDESEEDDEVNVTQPEFAALSLQAKTAHHYAEREFKRGLRSRLETLVKSGRATPAEKEQVDQKIGAVKLSLDKSGEPASTRAEEWIESREGLPKGAVWDPERRLRMASDETEEADPPENMSETSDDEAEDLVDRLFNRGKEKEEAAA